MTNDMKILANTTTTVCILKMYVARTKKKWQTGQLTKTHAAPLTPLTTLIDLIFS